MPPAMSGEKRRAARSTRLRPYVARSGSQSHSRRGAAAIHVATFCSILVRLPLPPWAGVVWRRSSPRPRNAVTTSAYWAPVGCVQSYWRSVPGSPSGKFEAHATSAERSSTRRAFITGNASTMTLPATAAGQREAHSRQRASIRVGTRKTRTMRTRRPKGQMVNHSSEKWGRSGKVPVGQFSSENASAPPSAPPCAPPENPIFRSLLLGGAVSLPKVSYSNRARASRTHL